MFGEESNYLRPDRAGAKNGDGDGPLGRLGHGTNSSGVRANPTSGEGLVAAGRRTRGGEANDRRKTPQPWWQRRGVFSGLVGFKFRHDGAFIILCVHRGSLCIRWLSEAPLTRGSKPNLGFP